MTLKSIPSFILLFCCLGWSFSACKNPQSPQPSSLEPEDRSQHQGNKQISSTSVNEISLLETYPGHQGRVLDTAFSAGGEILATSGQDLFIRVWDTDSGEELQTFPMHLVDMADIDISADSSLLASGEAIWNLESGQELVTLERESPLPAFVAFSPSEPYLAVARLDQGVMLWDLSSGEFTHRFNVGEEQRTKRMEYSPDGSRLVAGVIDGTVRIWDVQNGEIIQTLHYSGETDIHDLAYSADGRYLAATGRLPKAILWDQYGGEVLNTFPMRDNGLGIDFSQDGSLLAVSGGAERAILLFELPGGNLVRTLELGEQALAISFSPDGRYLAAGTFDGRILLWGLAAEQ